MIYKIDRAAVIGAGVMGAGIAAHLANHGLEVLLLDRRPEGVKSAENRPDEQSNALAENALRQLQKARHPVFTCDASRNRISCGNTSDDLAQLKDYDWVIETIIEDLPTKTGLYREIEKHRGPDSIVSTNTSGLPLIQISQGFSENLRQHFLGTHFFNPPTYVRLIELIPGPDTAPELISFMREFCRDTLDKRPLVVKDTPNFICNRLAIATVLNAMRLSRERGLTVEEVDALSGRALGRMQSAIFATSDAVGLDTVCHVIRNLYTNAPDDENREAFQVPEFAQKMLADQLLGAKSGGGFYKRLKQPDGSIKELALDLDTLKYREKLAPLFPCLEEARKFDKPAEQVQALLNGRDPGAEFAWELLAADLVYAAHRVGEIADTIVDIDRAMKWGYTWRLGPFECWDAIGLARSVARMKSEGRSIPARIEKMLAEGCESFYTYRQGVKHYFDFRSDSYQPV